MKTMGHLLASFYGSQPGTVPTVLVGGMLLAAMYLTVFDPMPLGSLQ